MTPEELINQLASKGGAIVSSNDCSELEIADAQATGRFAVDEEGLGFVRRTKEWLVKNRLPHEDEVIEYISNLNWSEMVTEREKTLVGGNINGFYSWMIRREPE